MKRQRKPPISTRPSVYANEVVKWRAHLEAIPDRSLETVGVVVTAVASVTARLVGKGRPIRVVIAAGSRERLKLTPVPRIYRVDQHAVVHGHAKLYQEEMLLYVYHDRAPFAPRVLRLPRCSTIVYR